MMPRLTLKAASRLHFGLWSLGGIGRPQFGGVGAMIDRPSLEIAVHAADQFCVEGAAADRAAAFASRWAEFHRLEFPRCRLEIVRTIPGHAGLGSGTQLALGVAAALGTIAGLPYQSPQELALSVGRGLRSAVGTYGFAFGGLIVEQGKLPAQPISSLAYRLDFPEPWRFVLARPEGQVGLAGDVEQRAFDALPPIQPAVTDALVSEARDRLIPAIAAGDFDDFADSLYRYGRLSGECFAARQGGPYNGPVVTRLIEFVQSLGYAGVGQSSWGPTVFIATATAEAATELAGVLQGRWTDPLEVQIAAPMNQGAVVTMPGPIEPHAEESRS